MPATEPVDLIQESKATQHQPWAGLRIGLFLYLVGLIE
jgi:hypothetical protein